MNHRLSILVYHRVLAQADPLLPELPYARRFDRHMAMLKHCFRVLPLGRASEQLRLGTLPARAACITFDDGYADNVTHALPILQRHGLSATFFIASDYLDGGQMWNDDVIACIRQARQNVLHSGAPGCDALLLHTTRHKQQAIEQLLAALKYLPSAQRQALARRLAPVRREQLMMDSRQVRALHAAGMEIGGHTASHPILARQEDAAAEADMARGKSALEGLIQAPVTLFAYPNGKPGVDYNQRHVELARKLGFTAAVSTEAGVAHAASDPLQLPRYTPWEPDRLRFLFRLLASRHA
ncbi:polysaccharide deacetylase family protein [Duganella violaceipulchra]|uniref:Peptidoglycan/xylan/chitin deacetylase (PgdA/CDA1 family) n=1 Tax=Duganella violaceipulchra TaxID=2849652 RepID=A0AA41L570_9BURK|nr:polysaccharide deacetylase family protein [Duganella violaceicalia]MBV6321867.1 polysaccharide deacetylase family protein [Duganella violaceicalia]MCP2007139.1 peptidoglycan/xylan/chitin deacetylase (PgdA/CDA1 family) [Duganella violaceicalia]